MTIERDRARRRFAICIHSDDSDLVTPRMVYEVLPDERAEASEYVRIVDSEGEDYLYPARDFVFVELTEAVERQLLDTRAPVMRSVATDA